MQMVPPLKSCAMKATGPSGVAVLVECATDNRNRAVSEVRHAFAKHGGNLGTDGSVAYLFDKIGSLVFAAGADEERIMEIALQAGADDVDSEDGVVEVVVAPLNFPRVEQAFKEAGLTPEMSELIQRPSTHVELRGAGDQGQSRNYWGLGPGFSGFTLR